MMWKSVVCLVVLVACWNDSDGFRLNTNVKRRRFNSNLKFSAKDVPRVGQVSVPGGLQLSEIGFGTWSWGNKLLWNYNPDNDEDLYESYRYVRSCGVTVFDTADSYGTFDLEGRAEVLLGQFERRYRKELLENNSNKSNIFQSFMSNLVNDKNTANRPQQIATKFAPYPWRISRSSMVNAAKSSLKRIYDLNNINEVDENNKLAIAQLHWSTANYQPFQERALWDGIADVYDSGLCQAVGVSNYGPEQLLKFAKRMEERQVPLASAQIQYSLMTAQAAQSAYDTCNEVGCALISYSPLCLGLLTGKYSIEKNILPPPGNPRRQLFTELLPGAQPLLKTLEAVSRENQKTMSQVAINWTICKGGIPIPGAKDLNQAKENLGAVGWKLTPAEVDALDKAANSVSKPMIQNIFQTK